MVVYEHEIVILNVYISLKLFKVAFYTQYLLESAILCPRGSFFVVVAIGVLYSLGLTNLVLIGGTECFKVRSASFDEIQLESQRAALLRHQSSADERTGLLQVPQVTNQRSRSFDSASGTGDEAGTFLEVPKRFQRRRSSGTKSSPPACIHCQYLEEYERQVSADQLYFIDHQEVRSLSYSDTSSSDGDADDEDASEPEYGNILLPPPTPFTPFAPSSPCGITFTLSPTHADVPTFLPLGSPPAQVAPLVFSPPATMEQLSPLSTSPPPLDEPPPMCRPRRRSISRQEAVFVEPLESSLENVAHACRSDEQDTREESQDTKTEDDDEEAVGDSEDKSSGNEGMKVLKKRILCLCCDPYLKIHFDIYRRNRFSRKPNV